MNPAEYRILWLAWMPIQKTNIFNMLKRNGVRIVMVESARLLWPEIDEKDPFEGLALKVLSNPFLRSARKRSEAILKLAYVFQVDGVIGFCPPRCHTANSSISLINSDLIQNEIPFLKLYGDMVDERSYSPSRTGEQISAFLELLASRKGG